MSLTDLFDPARLFRIALMVSLALVAIFAEAAPLGLSPTAPPSPDLLMCVLVYWSIRRPGSTPLLAVIALGLIRDFLTDVPIGAGALSLVLVTEVFKAQRHKLQRSSFVVEWMALAAAAFAATALVWLLVTLTLAQPPYLISLFHQCLYTAMVYPLMVVVFRWLLRITWRKAETV
ncbi:MAG: rod shape-determining protein MreD [Pseudomonadota bacterium]